jgi:hypothetical protein
MDNLCTYNNKWLSSGLAIGVQVIMIFTFLTVFFFLYVVKVEKDEFSEQLSIIIDNIMSKQKGDPVSYINIPTSAIPKNELEIAVMGYMDVNKRKQSVSDAAADKVVNDQNALIQSKATKALLYVWGVIILIITTLYIFKVCTSIVHIVQESLLVVAVVAFTEYTFLTFIASKYISASPNKVKREIATAVQNWIATHKVLSSKTQ